MLDLVYEEIMDARRKAKITILRRPNGSWNKTEISVLVRGLPMCLVSQHPKFSEILMLHGEFKKSDIEALGVLGFDHQVFLGLDNSTLPFPVRSL
ncbi:hypothetical protein A2662_01330 [Candidatus Giovannonibacteria bacterium RIFCSPHIGHO2_01_FULL_45_33]|uniref:Uncharacterized protein n=1 Tax=Candidatus Giovannonibacteria bacterium RIFCSPLOWO2_01_FULL_45_34 TaxID=1798351 RepID=A0A1F5WZJ4_9BACT|nr:MAG: hypothetical protein A2662_01330 [Candidatus Giovannonibacteria bacterium RIFCSPHIGHO2_01_FULL_45_33]OGF69236.1 MAG: hypothetical protein A3C73_00535 [Candidatus Giovannonibacteria bacterium RIFCSPHIGHO2_02_FULL_44_11]OGF81023.1 MAG: hypothetical protein A2930_00190 [Candidatus Giovannonibacteria bacterium RIFCSPLOWO2_01_FULL_45_34]